MRVGTRRSPAVTKATTIRTTERRGIRCALGLSACIGGCALGAAPAKPIASSALVPSLPALHRGPLSDFVPAASLRWLVQQNVVAIPRTSKVERLSENIDIFDFELSDDEMTEIFAMGTRQGRIVDFGFAPKWD